MRKPALIFAILAALGGAAASWYAAGALVRANEARTLDVVAAGLDPFEDNWAQPRIDGLRVILEGEAPDERARFQLLRRVSALVPPERIEDATRLANDTGPATPDFSLRVLRNVDDISLIGLVPKGPVIDGLEARFGAITSSDGLTDMLETVDHAEPEGWAAALGYGLDIATRLERAKVSIRPGEVEVTAVVPTPDQRARLMEDLTRGAPAGVKTLLDITAPRPVIAPFVFAAERTAEGWDIRSCSAETENGLAMIQAALGIAPDSTICRQGLGAPSVQWPLAVTGALDALVALGGGRVEIRDADILLTGPAGYDPAAFAGSVEDLRKALPPGFSLTGILPPVPRPDTGEPAQEPPQFVAERAADGTVRMHGDLLDDTLRETARVFAEAQFGFDTVADETQLREGLPVGWSTQVVAGLEALGRVVYGEVQVTETAVSLTGVATDAEAEFEIRKALAARLPVGIDAMVDLAVDESLKPREPQKAAVPPELCAERIAFVLAQAQIAFPPGETSIDDTSLPIVDEIAKILGQCPGARFEIGGHTDSQGRESSNMALSQARADSVLAALLERGTDMVFLHARGYGEERPVADNGTEAGRAANRRIEFRLVAAGEDAAAEDAGDTPDAVSDGTDDGADDGTPVEDDLAEEPLLPEDGEDVLIADDPDAGSGDDVIEEIAESAGDDASGDAEPAADSADGSGDALSDEIAADDLAVSEADQAEAEAAAEDAEPASETAPADGRRLPQIGVETEAAEEEYTYGPDYRGPRLRPRFLTPPGTDAQAGGND